MVTLVTALNLMRKFCHQPRLEVGDKRGVGDRSEPPGFAGGSNSRIGWSHDKPDDEQFLAGSPRPGGADPSSVPGPASRCQSLSR